MLLKAFTVCNPHKDIIVPEHSALECQHLAPKPPCMFSMQLYYMLFGDRNRQLPGCTGCTTDLRKQGPRSGKLAHALTGSR